MKTSQIFPVVIAVAMLATACGGDDDGGSIDSAGPDAVRADGGVDAVANAMPAMFPVQQDRFGRPAVNTALTAPFEPDATVKDTVKNTYNSAGMAMWQSFVPAIAANLAVIDALDTHLSGGGCGTQPLYNPAEGTPSSGYVGLAGALADDRMYVDTTQAGPCAIYLGVEAFALGLTEAQTCGGRVPHVFAPTQDPIDMSYGVLAGGLARVGVITDGIATDDQQDAVSNDVFPFLAPPTAPL